MSQSLIPGPRGPKPAPRHVREMRKTDKGKDKAKYANEPRLRVAAPTVTTKLSESARAEARRLIAECMTMKVLSRIDRGVIEATASAYATWQDAEKDVAENGFTVETLSAQGYQVMKQNPACQVLSDSWRRYLAGLVHLGLTPAARARVAALEEPDPADKAEEYLQ